MSRSTAQGGDEGLPGNWTDAVQETLLFSSDSPTAHTHSCILLFMMFTFHFSPWEDQWTKEASVFHALLSWLGALYSWLLPVLPRVHEWITPLVHGDPIASHGNTMENNVRAYWCIITKESWLISLNADLMWLRISEVWERQNRGSRVNSLQHSLYLTYLCGNRVDGAEKQTSSESFLHSEHLCVTMLTACLVAPESKKGFWKWACPDWDFHYLMLDHLSNCNISLKTNLFLHALRVLGWIVSFCA